MENESDSLIAPCGMNCGLCLAFLRDRNKCPGCRGPDDNKAKTRVNCKIKTCDFFKDNDAEFCFECPDFPCDKIEHIDERYRRRFSTSLIENLESIKNTGMKKFLEDEAIKWTCTECGGTISIHSGKCHSCGKVYHQIH